MVIGSRLNNILTALAGKQTVHPSHKAFLRSQGAHALVDLIDGAISEADYAARAQLERKTRQEVARQREEEAAAARRLEAALTAERDAALQARLKEEAEQQRAARIRYESSPEFIAKQKTRELLHKYGVDEFVAAGDFKRLMPILHELDAGRRLSKEDVVWLKVHANRYRLAGVLAAHHRREADGFLAEFRRGGDPWQAISASGHLRKCDASQEAIDLLATIPAQRLKQDKLKSAMLTTQGVPCAIWSVFPTLSKRARPPMNYFRKTIVRAPCLAPCISSKANTGWGTIGIARPKNVVRLLPAMIRKFARCCAACPKRNAGQPKPNCFASILFDTDGSRNTPGALDARPRMSDGVATNQEFG
ncbi:hypothetical protein H0I39_05615 [Ottowia beijingensis]|uniref:Uncharacterized protein n=1 Tax=Ottowia beijingensis TaxID=1207057 RepID=A0A853IL20_9BURK|nr:hypothetical protein [Ottowia beijingensis]NZA01373.1 hypothetical protein [Ottowia beijingensis]